MSTRTDEPFIIYNLHPGLAGPFGEWRPHMERAAEMGFNWLLLNPLQRTGRSQSLYAISHHEEINPALVDPQSDRDAWDQVGDIVRQAHELGLRIMVDLVFNHTAVDSPLLTEHRDWFRWTESGRPVHPGVWEGDRLLKMWEDLAQVANAESKDRDALWAYWTRIIERFVGLDFDGIRGHMAHQVPAPLWKQLLGHARALNPDIALVAETLGCPDWQVIEVARLPFDLCLNSSRWWDFHQSWCLDQYRAMARHTRTISFPESHDTPRLLAELEGDEEAVKLRYLFSTLFSTGLMMPMGFEFGFISPLDPDALEQSSWSDDKGDDWDTPRADLRDFITQVNAIKRDFHVFQEDNPIERLNQPRPTVVVLRKESRDGKQKGLIVLNTNPRRETPVMLRDLRTILASAEVRDVTPGQAPSTAESLVDELPPSAFRVYVGE